MCKALPPGWEEFRHVNGRTYYLNHIDKTSQWEDPRTQGTAKDEVLLPMGWEMRLTEDGMKYFVNHNTGTTTFQDPRPGAMEVASGSAPNGGLHGKRPSSLVDNPNGNKL